jgi:hypothetical protein
MQHSVHELLWGYQNVGDFETCWTQVMISYKKQRLEINSDDKT